MDQARLEKYAGWLVQNKELKGTPEFEKVSTAYKSLRSGGADKPKDYALSEVPLAALKNAPTSLGKAVTGIATGIKDAVLHPVDTLSSVNDVVQGGIERLKPQALVDAQASLPWVNKDTLKRQEEASGAVGQDYKDAYGGYENIKRTIAEDPARVLVDAASVASGGQLAAGKVPTVVSAASKAAKAAKAKASALNKLDTSYPEVAPYVADDLAKLADSGEYDLADVTSTNSGARGAAAKMFTDNKAEIDADYKLFKDELDPNKATNPSDRKLRIEAEKAFASGDHQVMDKAIKAQIAAVETLVGHTKQGANLVNNLKKGVEISKLRDGYHGGISKYTDTLSPLSLIKNYRNAGNIAGSAFTGSVVGSTGLTGAGVLAAGYTGGRIIDKVTGRRSLPKLYEKQNRPSGPLPEVGQDLPDVLEERRAAKDAEVASKKALDDQKQREKQEIADAKLQRKEADIENTYRSAALKKAQAAQKAQELAEKQKASAGPPKIDQADVSHVYRLMRMKAEESKRLAKAQEVSKKSEAPKQKVTGPLDSYGKPIRDPENYAAGKAKIIARQETVRQTAESTKSPKAKKALLKALEDLQENGAKGPKNYKVRMEIYKEALASVDTPADKQLLQDKLFPLANHFPKK